MSASSIINSERIVRDLQGNVFTSKDLDSTLLNTKIDVVSLEQLKGEIRQNS